MITIHTFRNHNFIVLILTIFSIQLFAEDVVKGEQIFKQNCTACHMMTDTKLVGPGLKGVTDKYEKEWLIKWIRNSQELIASGDERAIKIYEEYNKVAMSSFYFSDDEFSDLLAYMASPPIKEEPIITANETVLDNGGGINTSTETMIYALVLLVLVFALLCSCRTSRVHVSYNEEVDFFGYKNY